MTAVWYRVRADLRDHWRAVLGLALLVGVAGGAVLGATAGARRTSSAYSRFLDASNAGDVLVNPNTPNGAPLPDYAAMARLPQVRDSAFVAGIDLIGRDSTGRIDPSWYDVVNIASGDGRMLRRMERPKLVAGRLPDPKRWDELYVNEALARNHHLHVGSRVPMVWYPESVFKTLGFTRRQVSSSIAWQATTIGLAALVIGIPLGIVLGRVGWTLLAHELGAVAEPIWPVGAALLAVPITLVFVNLLAYFPGRLAARTRPAVVLRSE
jgi:FtsX-like permease family